MFAQLITRVRTVLARPRIGVTVTGFPLQGTYERFLQRLMGPAGLPFVLLARLLSPIVRIRFGLFFAQRIGHFPIDLELYLIEKREWRWKWPITLDFIYFFPPLCNEQLVRMYSRRIRTWKFAAALYFCQKRFFGENGPLLRFRGRDIYESRDEERVLCRTKPSIEFTKDEIEFGESELRRMGIKPGTPIVLFHNRDSHYLASWANWNTSYHNYRDFSIRTMEASMQDVARWGYAVIRYGFRMGERLSIAGGPIYDYAFDYRSDFMDMYLLWKCRYFVGNTAGPLILRMVFRRPSVTTNLIPISFAHHWNASDETDLFIPKMIRSVGDGRLLSLRETIALGADKLLFAEKYTEFGLEPVENSAEDIRDVVYEMEHRLNRTWVPSDNDEALQRRFWQILRGGELSMPIAQRIGALFLRNYPDYLD